MLAPIVERVAHDLATSAPGHVSARTPLTRAGHIAANRNPTTRRFVKTPTDPSVASSCRDCGTALAEHASKLCPACWIPERTRLAIQRAERGRASRARIRQTTGIDATQTAIARQKRHASLRAERALRDAWDREHHGELLDQTRFAAEVLSQLVQVPLSAIIGATGLSVSAASQVRTGKLIPHVRHWAVLHELVITRTPVAGQ